MKKKMNYTSKFRVDLKFTVIYAMYNYKKEEKFSVWFADRIAYNFCMR